MSSEPEGRKSTAAVRLGPSLMAIKGFIASLWNTTNNGPLNVAYYCYYYCYCYYYYYYYYYYYKFTLISV